MSSTFICSTSLYQESTFTTGAKLGILENIEKKRVGSLGQEDPLEEEMATHSSTLDWRIPWTEEPGRLQSKGLQRVGHNLVTKQQVLF